MKKSTIQEARTLSNKVKRVKNGETVLLSGEEVSRLKRFYSEDFVLQGATEGFLVSKN